MIWVDYAIVGAIALSALIGFFRGFFRETIGLATWLIAFLLGFWLTTAGASLLRPWVSVRSVRLAIAFGVIFLCVLIVGAVVNHMLHQLIEGTGFAGTDRVLGAAFGFVRGVAVLIILVLLAGLTPVPRDAWWQQSQFMGHLQDGAVWVRGWLPSELAGRIRFDTTAPVSSANTKG